MKITKNALKLLCMGVLTVLIVIQAASIVRIHKIEKNLNNASYNVVNQNDDTNIQPVQPTESAPTETDMPVHKTIIVLDPGHGKSSGSMTEEEKSNSGFVKNAAGSWGDWRHWKSGTIGQDCEGSGCNGRAPEGRGCWYPIGDGDRETEPEINLRNALAAKSHLEGLGYEVRMTRTSNEENPSITRRLYKCYPNDDINSEPDAAAYVCIHSNSGGGRGSAYLALGSGYDHKFSNVNYAENGNTLGRMINDRIISQTSMPAYSDGCYTGLPDLVLFHKSPITIAYLEIGFYDSSSDLAILESESDEIGKAIAEGIDDYIKQKG